MNAAIFIAVLAMLAMVNAAPVQEDQKNLQGLLDVLADQKNNKESIAQVANKDQAEAQIVGAIARRVLRYWANKQQDDDENQPEAQHSFHFYANKQQDDGDDIAEAQLWGALLKTAGSALAPYAISYLKDKLG